jgi:signal transduction histidine kinase
MRFHAGWRLKAVLPVALILLAGLGIFEFVTLEVEAPQRVQLLAIAAGGALAICAVLLVALAVLIQRPLVELSRRMEEVRSGDLYAHVSFSHRDDDIGSLGRDFNDMVRQLRESRDELQRIHQTQMSRAEHLATLGELAAGLAHEVRNPLAGIAGAVDILARELPASSPGRGIVGDVQQEVRRIQGTLNELLEYARPKPFDIRPADLNVTVEQTVNLARQQITTRPIDLRFRPGSLPPVSHDRLQMQRLILNLLLNAFQAIDGTGEVFIETSADGECARVRVRDTGRGIAPEALANIFRPFFTTKRQGTGLGLSLSRRIAEQHGGAIEARSTPGEGSEFEVRLPLTAPELQTAGAKRNGQDESSHRR